LSIVEERGNTTIVHLERASSPAPSKAALGWLETSIRSYAKYIDIVSRALAVVQDEQDSTRRERLRLDEIKALLDEMQG
jgi:DNA gyrase inhibitor GyrI